MSLAFAEIGFASTPIGEIVLRRRRMSQFGDRDIFEIKLDDEYLMTSLFYEAEEQLAHLGLAALDGDSLDVVIGGLGLGYTAAAALEDSRISSLIVVDYLEAVIQWHKEGLVPASAGLNQDTRCEFYHADFFALSRNTKESFDPKDLSKKHDAILLDIDHTPTNVLHQTNARFYTHEGLTELREHIKPGGVFGLWADGEPEPSFTEHLASIFKTAKAHTIEFDNPITGGTSRGAVYVATC